MSRLANWPTISFLSVIPPARPLVLTSTGDQYHLKTHKLYIAAITLNPLPSIDCFNEMQFFTYRNHVCRCKSTCAKINALRLKWRLHSNQIIEINNKLMRSSKFYTDIDTLERRLWRSAHRHQRLARRHRRSARRHWRLARGH